LTNWLIGRILGYASSGGTETDPSRSGSQTITGTESSSQHSRGTFRSVRALIKTIHDYIRTYNQHPRPFHWVASASQITRNVNKYKKISETGD